MSCGDVDPACTRCGLSRTRTMVVPGSGDCGARLVLVGEAPGRDEDLKGAPFVGRAGRILDQALASAGVDRKRLFITNLVKCRPPGNRRPKEEEASACRAHLDSELRAVSPDVVCVLGATAAAHMLGEARRMGEVVGTSREVLVCGRPVKVYIAYHPAACIYDRGKLQSLADTLRACAAEAWPSR